MCVAFPLAVVVQLYSWPPDATTVPPERRVTTYIVFVTVLGPDHPITKQLTQAASSGHLLTQAEEGAPGPPESAL